MRPGSVPSLVLLGGTQVFTDLAQQYAALMGWKNVDVLPAPTRTIQDVTVVSQLLAGTPPDQPIIVLTGAQSYDQSWESQARRAGREVCVLLAGLTPAGRLQKLHRLVAARQGKKESRPIVGQTLRRIHDLLLKKHPLSRRTNEQSDSTPEGRTT
jgi:hypothetical protein